MTDNLVWLLIRKPTPALRDRMKSSQDFTFAPPLRGRGFSGEARTSCATGLRQWLDLPLISHILKCVCISIAGALTRLFTVPGRGKQ